jgi:hypothetical protein
MSFWVEPCSCRISWRPTRSSWSTSLQAFFWARCWKQRVFENSGRMRAYYSLALEGQRRHFGCSQRAARCHCYAQLASLQMPPQSSLLVSARLRVEQMPELRHGACQHSPISAMATSPFFHSTTVLQQMTAQIACGTDEMEPVGLVGHQEGFPES